MSLETIKTLGGVGAILMFVGILPFISYFGIIELIGVILVFIALYNLAGYYNERGIFNNAFYGLISGIVGGIISGVVVIYAVLTSLTDFLYKVFPTWNGDWTLLPGLTPDWSRVTPTDIFPFFGQIIVALAVVWIFAIISAFFIRRSLTSISTKANVGLFSTAGLLLLIGAFLIILVVGLILIWIAALLLAIAFFQMKPQQTQTTM